MKYLLDSNILIALGLDTNPILVKKASECDEGDLVTSAIVLAEVIHGSARDKSSLLEKLALMAEEIPVLPFDENASRAYALLPLKRASYGRLIAAHALSLDLTVITNNPADFVDVPGLQIENWAV